MMNTKTDLRITKLPEGGFIVGEAYRRDDMWGGPLFACTDIGEALAYIRRALSPPATA